MKSFLLCLFWLMFQFASAEKCFLNAPPYCLSNPISALTIADFQQLIAKVGENTWTHDANSAEVLIEIADFDTSNIPFSRHSQIHLIPYPLHHFEWHFQTRGNQKVARLTAVSFLGISFGLYALLQEKLNFFFYHPRHTKFPQKIDFNDWNGIWKGKPNFDKKGFHIHSMHPLELTDQLHNPTSYGGIKDVKEYIDWLVRNGQNYFDFCLLRTVKLKSWIPHAKDFVKYGHERGILMGVDISLHMIQQKSYQLYPHSWSSQKKKIQEIEENLKMFQEIGFDVLNIEHEAAEFLGSNQAKREELRLWIINWCKDKKIFVTGRQHVVKDEKEMLQKKHTDFQWNDSTKVLDSLRGLMVHTVMFYSMTENHAPVYENQNLRHMFELLLKEKDKREVWYYPETAYWITFDNSIPMLLLPYLNSRLQDIDTCIAYEIPGHITFSSGWEWGYWLFDWSIARWSWDYGYSRKASQFYDQFVHHAQKSELFQQYLDIQQHYLKDLNLMKWMTAMTVTDEISFMNKQFQPRPDYSYRYIRNRAWLWVLDSLKEEVIPLLETFAEKTDSLVELNEILHEIDWGVQITGLRALHRSKTLQYIIAKREKKLKKIKRRQEKIYLQEAAEIRKKAIEIVKLQERNYRYPYRSVAEKRWDYTAYHFGYLYTVSNLHFWRREELQAKRNRYRVFFKNIWPILRIVGVI